MNNNTKLCLGYGECKLGDVSKKALNMDLIKLAIFTQRTININDKQNVSACSIGGFKLQFFITKLQNEKIYLMKKVEEVVFPQSVDDLPSFINMKTSSDLLQISKLLGEVQNGTYVEKISWKKEIQYDDYLKIN